MRFIVRFDVAPIGGVLRYVERDHGFDFQPVDPSVAGVGLALVAKDLCLELDAYGRICYPWGYSPRAAWIQSPVVSRSEPKSLPAAVFVDDVELTRGVFEPVEGRDDWECVAISSSGGLRVRYRNRRVSDPGDFVRCRIASGVDLEVGVDTLAAIELVVDPANVG